MAKFLSQVYTSISGSVGGITYLTMPGGPMLARARVSPVHAPTPFRTFAKNALSQAASDWDALAVAEKLAWNNWAIANGLLKGRQEMIAGQSLRNFVLNSGIAGAAVITVNTKAPLFVGHPVVTLTAAGFVVPASTGVAFRTRVTSPEDCIVMLELSPALSNGRYYWKGPWDTTRSIAFIQVAAAVTTTTFTGLIAGQRHYCRMRAFTQDATPAQVGIAISSAAITYSDAITNP